MDFPSFGSVAVIRFTLVLYFSLKLAWARVDSEDIGRIGISSADFLELSSEGKKYISDDTEIAADYDSTSIAQVKTSGTHHLLHFR